MSSSQRAPARNVPQEYIAKVRYSNALPPPPNPPKLLDIPGTGLAGGQYTSAEYGARLAREQALNIEADAELGMPIDLVGIPGVFDGNDKAISARTKPHIHPADKALLRPLASLGKATSGNAVSFLRRTEYTSSQGPQHFSSSTSKDLLRLRNDPNKTKKIERKDDPVNAVRHIVKGFDLAYPKDAYKGPDTETKIRGAAVTDAEAKAWSNPKHPSKSDVQVLDSYPVLPDLDAMPASSAYLVVKFITNPAAAGETYDTRLDTAMLRPTENPQKLAAYEQKMAEWDMNSGKAQPQMEYDYDYYLTPENSAVRGIKRKFDVNDPENEDAELYTDEFEDGMRGFKFDRIRTYETYTQHANTDNLYNDTVGLALHDPESDVGVAPDATKRLEKAAYFYPIIQRTGLRPKRNLAAMAYSQPDENRVDELQVSIGEADEDEMRNRLEKRAELDTNIKLPEVATAEE